MDNADKVVNQWLQQNKQKIETPVSDDPDSIVQRWLAKKESNPHPLDDTALSAQNPLKMLGDQSYNGFCERFAEEQTFGKSGMYPTAADAWNSYIEQGKAYGGDVKKAPQGSLIYFDADSSNSGDGHVGISDGQGNITAATYHGVQSMPINKWVEATGQKPMGYVIP